jgi:hypothetical protein
MKLKEQKVSGIHQNNSLRAHSLHERRRLDFILPLNNHVHYFTLTSNIDQPFIVDWQLSGK